MNAKNMRLQLSIKRKIILLFVVIMGVSFVGTGFVIFSGWIRSSSDMMSIMANDLNVEIEKQITEFIEIPLHINEVQHFILENEIVDLTNEREREQFFVGVLSNHGDAVYSFSFGTEAGEYYGARKNALGEIEIMRNDVSTLGYTTYYSVTAEMTAGEVVSVTSAVFDPRTRDWYIAAKTAGVPIFSPIYKHFVMNDLTISAAYPIYDENENLLGVLGAHVILSGIDAFMEELVQKTSGTALLIENATGYLVANTLGEPNFVIGENSQIDRFTISELTNSGIRDAYQNYLETGENEYRYRQGVNDEFYQIIEFHRNGIDWLVISAIPEAYLSAGISNNIIISFSFLLLTMLIAIILYRNYLHRAFLPLTSLVEATKLYGIGNFSIRVPVAKNDEVGIITNSMNEMAEKTELLLNHLEDQVEIRTIHLETVRSNLLEVNSKLILETKFRKENEQLLTLFFSQSLTGFFFMMLDEPIEWNVTSDKELLLDYVFDHQRITKANAAMLQQYGQTEAEIMAMTPNQSFAHDLANARSIWREMFDRGYVHVRTNEQRADGTPIIIEGDYIVMYDVEGRIIGHFGNQQDVTATLGLQANLRDSEEKYRLLYSSMNQGLALHELITDEHGKPIDYVFLDINDMYTQLLGVHREHAIGKRITEVMPLVESYWIEAFGKVALTREPLYYENYLATTGRYYATYTYSPKYRQFAVLVSDITDRKRMELELTKEKETLSATLHSIGDGVITTDEHGIITSINEVTEQMTGWKEEDAKGKPFEDVFRIVSEVTGKPALNPIALVFQSHRRVELENHTILIARDGTKHDIEDCASPIHSAAGDILGVVLVFRDVTDKRHKLRQIEFISNHDYLTGLFNRRYYVESFELLCLSAENSLGVLMLDVNGLKIINDAYGHDVGDIALKTVAEVLIETFDSDAVIARIGGDEFAVLLPNTSPTDLQAYKDALKTNMAKRPVMNIPLSVAVGYELKNETVESLDEMLKLAENHMYRHKLSEGVGVRNRAIQAIFQTLSDKYEPEKIHSHWVSQYARKIGEALGIDKESLKELEMAALLHDIGKISIPDAILKKPGKLTLAEYETIKSHTEVGYQILRAADEFSDLAIHALHHHERWDGLGYPNGLKGEKIPLFSRIICVVDAFEAMTATRPYRKSMPVASAIDELKRCSGTQFDPALVSVFIEQVIPSIESIG